MSLFSGKHTSAVYIGVGNPVVTVQNNQISQLARLNAAADMGDPQSLRRIPGGHFGQAIGIGTVNSLAERTVDMGVKKAGENVAARKLQNFFSICGRKTAHFQNLFTSNADVCLRSERSLKV